MNRPTSSKKFKLDIPSNAKQCDGLIIPKVTGHLPSVEERFEIYMIDTEPLLEYACAGFRLFVSRFTDQILINYMSLPGFDVTYKTLANNYRWLYVIRQVWLKVPLSEKSSWEKNAKSKHSNVEDLLFDVKLAYAIQTNLYEQSVAYKEKKERAEAFRPFIEANVDDLFVVPTQLTFFVDYSPTLISPHAINFFKVCIHLDYFLDTLFEVDAKRTSELIKYAISYSEEKDDAQLKLSLTKLMPSLKFDDQHAWIIKALRENSVAHFDVRELSLFPLNVLEHFFRRFNPIDYGEEMARNIRSQAIDLGIVDIVLDCLSYFAHQKARCRSLRPTHMDMAYFKVGSIVERSTPRAVDENSALHERRMEMYALAQHCLKMCGHPPNFLDGLEKLAPYAPTSSQLTNLGQATKNYDITSTDNTIKGIVLENIMEKTMNSTTKWTNKNKGKKPQKPQKQFTQIQGSSGASIDFTSYTFDAASNNLTHKTVLPFTSDSAASNCLKYKGVYNAAEKLPLPSKITSANVVADKMAWEPKLMQKYSLTASSSSKFAKGTGYGSGMVTSKWNVSEHVAKKKYEVENVAALLKILQSFIKPKSPLIEELLSSYTSADFERTKSAFLDVSLNDAGDACSMIDEKLLQLLHRSCLRKTLLAYLVNDSLLDITQNKEIYESVFGLLAAIAQTRYVEAHTTLFIIDKSDQDNTSDEDCNSDEDLVECMGESSGFVDDKTDEDNSKKNAMTKLITFNEQPCSSSSITASTSLTAMSTVASDSAALHYGRRSTRALRPLESSIKKPTSKNFLSEQNGSISSKLSAKKRNKKRFSLSEVETKDGEVEQATRDRMDVFYFLFFDNCFISAEKDKEERSNQPLLLKQLQAVSQQIDSYLTRMSRRSGQLQYQNTLSEEDLELFSGDEDRLRNLSILSKLICAAIEKKVALVGSSRSLVNNDNNNTAEELSNVNTREEVEENYYKMLKPLQFETIPFYEDGSGRLAISYYFYKDMNQDNASAFGKNIRRITQEIISLSSALPFSFSSSVFIRSCEERIYAAKMLITGPSGTPYANGCFEFDIFFPRSYPNEPMKVNLQTTGNGTVRFNPNLYNCGKVCLSILNTWNGRPEERWNADTSSLLQVIVSLQSLVLVPEPYFNEPGYQTSIGTPTGKKSSANYNSTIRAATVRWAMLEMLKNPPVAFADVIRRHFYLKHAEIIKQIDEWIVEERQLNHNIVKLQGDFDKLKREFDVLMKATDMK